MMAAARGLEAWGRHFPNGDAIAGEKAIARGFSADFRAWNAPPDLLIGIPLSYPFEVAIEIVDEVAGLVDLVVAC